jgi:hypothetical protein
MNTVLALVLCGAVGIADPPVSSPRAQNAGEAGTSADDISRPPSKTSDRFVSATCAKNGTCSERYESKNEPKDEGGVTVIRKRGQVELFVPGEYVPRHK